jgi:isocitrate dehydrogenase kinase/phosphatase
MPPPLPSPTPEACARLLRTAFATYRTRFRALTRRAASRFARRDVLGHRADAAERLALYPEAIAGVLERLRGRLRGRVRDRRLWRAVRTAYSAGIAGRPDAELAETFFNSVTRRVFDTVGVDPAMEFVTTSLNAHRRPPARPVTRTFGPAPTPAVVDAVFGACPFAVPFANRPRDVRRVARCLDERLGRSRPGGACTIELARPVFYRGVGAYLVGRVRNGAAALPLAIAFHNDPGGVAADAVLTDEDRVSILFSFARSYFHAEAPEPRALVRFLKTLLPRKRTAELYISIGENRHGKTELYRDLLQHFSRTTDVFERAAGTPGMVMVVFTMPSYDMVFKVIRDRFVPPKTVTRRAVKDRYRLVFKHDRAGRLVDAQEFEDLRLHRRLFAPELLEELLEAAGATVRLDGERVVIDHCYLERRVTPLNLYLQAAAPRAARAVLDEYGDAIKDLARTNIFPGDLLLKNFGVTRHGRVVFYDYDELGLLTDLTFRAKPAPRSYDDEMAAEPWYYVGPEDVFPEEFRMTFGVGPRLMSAFEARHGDLFEPDFWAGLQSAIRDGAALPVLPYPQAVRLPGRGGRRG